MPILPFPDDTEHFAEFGRLQKENEDFRRLLTEQRAALLKLVRQINNALLDGGGGQV